MTTCIDLKIHQQTSIAKLQNNVKYTAYYACRVGSHTTYSSFMYKLYTKLCKNRRVGEVLAGYCVQVVYKTCNIGIKF